ncbi:MAG: hypothetical protein CMJ67_02160 [Planctomycetaceae bacterium]|nr:hypothetical protein [Planctomycetaceae bacterium]
MRFRSFDPLIRSMLFAILFMMGSGVVLAAQSEATGVLEAASRETPGAWRIDGVTYVFPEGVQVPKIGSGPSRQAGEARIGEIVRVSYEERDGIRYVGQVQLFGVGPESIQDGPHLIWKDETSATMITIVDGKVIRSEHEGLVGKKVLSTPSRTVPRLQLSGPVEPQVASWPDAERILAVSDLEGNRQTFLDFLRGNGVVDDAGTWIWGDGHLVLDGDIVDRGPEVTELLWMIRRLAREALESGGRVHYILGNHESMVMAGDLRYIHPKYRFTTDRIGITYDVLHGSQSELGRWLRSHNSVERIGPLLFVHAGYSPELDRLGLELDEINQAIRSGLGPPAWPKDGREDLRTGLIWHSQGPHWYRGYFPRHAADWGGRPSEQEIASILQRHGAEHIVVGHTVVDDVGWIDGRPELIGIDVDWSDPTEAAGLLWDGGRLFKVDAKGEKTPLVPSKPDPDE